MTDADELLAIACRLAVAAGDAALAGRRGARLAGEGAPAAIAAAGHHPTGTPAGQDLAGTAASQPPAGLTAEEPRTGTTAGRRPAGATSGHTPATTTAGRRPAVPTTTKSSATDLVTAFDRGAEATIVEGLAAARPDDAVVGEEGTDRRGTSGVAWFVDPIDGTTNFVYDLPAWSTSIAAGDTAGIIAAAVYAPALGELFTATRGGGAALNGTPIRASEQASLGLALVATGFSYAAERRRAQARVVAEVIAEVRDIRRLGSAALDLCYVAAGRVDAYFETGLNRWDSAAGELIAAEAGCLSGDHRGGPPRPGELLVAAPGVFAELQRLLAAATR